MKTAAPTHQQGFSLIEIVLVVMIIGFIGLLIANWPASINLNSSSARQSLAKEILTKQLEDLRAQGYGSLANGTSSFTDTRLEQLPEAQSSIEISDCPPTLCPNEEPIKQVEVQLSWQGTNGPETAQLNTLIAEDGLR